MPNKVRRMQTRRCASHNYIVPNAKARRNFGTIERSSATRSEKLAVHRIAKAVNKTHRRVLRRRPIKQINGFWCVLTATGDLLAQYVALDDAINFAHANAPDLS